jgi:selenocysteine-specific elongation factor
MTAEELAFVVTAVPGRVAGVIEGNPEVARLGDLYALAGEVEAARVRLREALKERAEDRPESPEISVAEARTAAGLDSRLADALIVALAEGSEPEIRIVEAGVSLRDAEEVPPELEKEAEELLEALRRAGVEPPTTEATPAARLLLKRGEAVRIDAGLFAASETAEAVLEDIKSACREDGEISLAGFRDSMGTSRKYAQAWLEYADEAGVTRRVGDTRVLTRRHRQEIY